MSPTLDFTTLARARQACGFEDEDVSKNVLLESLIKSVSGELERELRKTVKRAAKVEILPVWPGSRVVSLAATPVLDSPAPTVLESAERDFTTAPTTLSRGVDFIIENDTGLLRLIRDVRGNRDLTSGFVLGPTYLKVSYTGGLADTTAELIEAYPDLTAAADLQIAYAYKRRDTPGGNLVIGPSSTTFDQSYNLLPSVRRTLEMLKRRGIY